MSAVRRRKKAALNRLFLFYLWFLFNLLFEKIRDSEIGFAFLEMVGYFVSIIVNHQYDLKINMIPSYEMVKDDKEHINTLKYLVTSFENISLLSEEIIGGELRVRLLALHRYTADELESEKVHQKIWETPHEWKEVRYQIWRRIGHVMEELPGMSRPDVQSFNKKFGDLGYSLPSWVSPNDSRQYWSIPEFEVDDVPSNIFKEAATLLATSEALVFMDQPLTELIVYVNTIKASSDCKRYEALTRSLEKFLREVEKNKEHLEDIFDETVYDYGGLNEKANFPKNPSRNA
jgi:hypothetical protein